MNTQAPQTNILAELNSAIKNAVASSGDAVRTKYIESEVSKEIERRASLLANIVEALNSIRKEIGKIKPDIVSYDDHGAVAFQSFSKNVAEGTKKLKERMEKGTAALEKVIFNHDYSEVEEVIKKIRAV